MNWYQGSIAEAVAYSQTEKALFCVVILGTDDSSKQFETSLGDKDVVSLISENRKFVCIRVSEGSHEHQQFLQIYTNANSPSVYCISTKGMPVEIITSPDEPSVLRKKFESALQKHQELAFSGTAAAVPTSSGSTEVADNSASSPQEATSTSSLEVRIERAKKLAAAKQQKKADEEAEGERQREIERRQQGRGAAELKRWQEEEETKRLAEERRKGKQEDAKLRQRLREQIAQDRLDRQVRNNPNFPNPVNTNPINIEKSANSNEQNQQSTSKPAATFSGQARLQFRLPSGLSQNRSFDPQTKLQEVRQFLIDNSMVPYRDFTISLAFPRREFTANDYNSSLRDLGLLPSAALLILPVTTRSMVQNASNAGQGLLGVLSALIGYMLYPMTVIFSYFQRAILPAGSPNSAEAGASSTNGARSETHANRLRRRNMGQAVGDQQQQRTNSTDASTSAKSERTANRDPSSFGADGNVHRLRSGEADSDDEQATWNGNSTQQM